MSLRPVGQSASSTFISSNEGNTAMATHTVTSGDLENAQLSTNERREAGTSSPILENINNLLSQRTQRALHAQIEEDLQERPDSPVNTFQFYNSSWLSYSANVDATPSSLMPLSHQQPTFQMPLERRPGSSNSRTQQRRYFGNHRKRPYRMANLNEFFHTSRYFLPVVPEEEPEVPNNTTWDGPLRLFVKRTHPVQQSDEQLARRLMSNEISDLTSAISSSALRASGSVESQRAIINSLPALGNPSPSTVSLLVDRLSNFNNMSERSETVTSASVRGSGDSLGSNTENTVAATEGTLHRPDTEFRSLPRLPKRLISKKIDSTFNIGESYRFFTATSTMPELTVHARRLANKMIRHARSYKIPEPTSMWCLDCDQIPRLPVTGPCGHTRCTKCIQENGACHCGKPAPKYLFVNTVVQDLIGKMIPDRVVSPRMLTANVIQHEASSAAALTENATTLDYTLRPAHYSVSLLMSATISHYSDIAPRTPMTSQIRFKRAHKLLSSGQFRKAAPHLARVAASHEPWARIARTLLIQTIALLSESYDERRLERELFRAIRLQSAVSWLRTSDLECVVCYDTYRSPVTTPCGHTYCRTCIERSLDYRKKCALCSRPLAGFNLAETRETEFVCAALTAIGASNAPPPLDPDVIPIFVCTVAFPAIPCPLFIFDPRYWMMIRRVLESGSRKFGMVAYDRDHSYSDYGTVLEVCDCVHLEDGRSILSTVGVSRFRVIERDVRDGCDVARIQPLADIIPSGELVVWDLRVLATQISYKATAWLDSIEESVRTEIETAFGHFPRFDLRENDWWQNTDGPAWVWWLIAILPLRPEIKILILSTQSLLKRMMAVSRTLEALDHEPFSGNNEPECEFQNALSSTDDWIEQRRA